MTAGPSETIGNDDDHGAADQIAEPDPRAPSFRSRGSRIQASVGRDGGVSNAELLAALREVSVRLDRMEQDLGRISSSVPAAPLTATGPQDHEPTAAEESVAEPSRRRSGVRGGLTLVFALLLFGGGAYWVYLESLEPTTRTADPPSTADVLMEEAESVADGDEIASLTEVDDAAEPSDDAEDAGGATEEDSGLPASPEANADDAQPVVADTPEAIDTPPDVVAIEEPQAAVAIAAAMAELPEDAPETIRATANAALNGDSVAQHDLASWYAVGRAEPDFERAVFWYRQAAEAEVPNALYNLGVLTQRGRGVPQDPAAAIALFERAADAGHSHAQVALGLAYLTGTGVDTDSVQAARYFSTASANDNPRGAFYLGYIFENGIDGAPDIEGAAAWYRVAADGGDDEAAAALARLESEGLLDGAPAEAEPATAPEPTDEVDDAGATDEETSETVEREIPDRELTRDDIREIQTILTDLGYDPGPTDGLMGRRTEDAIEEFQGSVGMTVTGEPSMELLVRLREADA